MKSFPKYLAVGCPHLYTNIFWKINSNSWPKIMEALYLLGSIVSTTLTSLALSLLLFFRTLFLRKSPSRAAPSTSSSDTSEETVSLYEGTVWHERRRPVHHSFRYSVRYALFDLDHATHAPPDHLSADQARQITATTGPMCRSLSRFNTF